MLEKFSFFLNGSLEIVTKYQNKHLLDVCISCPIYTAQI